MTGVSLNSSTAHYPLTIRQMHLSQNNSKLSVQDLPIAAFKLHLKLCILSQRITINCAQKTSGGKCKYAIMC